MSDDFAKFIHDKKNIVIIQADNPDGDSLASALALEHILEDLDHNVSLFCGVAIPGYLHYMNGWDRVSNFLPARFDASIIVDTSALSLLETAAKSNDLHVIKTRPCAIIDHHSSKSSIDFAELTIVEPAVATCEIIYTIAAENSWSLSSEARDLIACGVLSDSLGLMSEGTTSHSIKVIAELVDQGVSLSRLDNERRKLQKKSQAILAYKGRLISRISYSESGRIAYVTIPWSEIEKHSHEYNPSMLVIDEMRMVEGVEIAAAFKTYPDGKITCKLRSNHGFPVCDKIANEFGGGGHPYASGFKITDGRAAEDIARGVLTLGEKYLMEVVEE